MTEAITGIHLVEWQIRVALGDALPMTQEEVLAQRRGHAIEVRSTPKIRRVARSSPRPGGSPRSTRPTASASASTPATQAGDAVSQYYDNLVAKLIVWGKDRPTAIARTIRALEETTVDGVATTIPVDLTILRHHDFANVEHSTNGSRSGSTSRRRARRRHATAGRACRATARPLVQRRTTVEVNGKRFDVTLWVPEVDARWRPVRPGPGPSREPCGVTAGLRDGAAGSGSVTVPMQGTIVKVLVEVGHRSRRARRSSCSRR